jgi:DNA-binding XRE family transcriptional regulator
MAFESESRQGRDEGEGQTGWRRVLGAARKRPRWGEAARRARRREAGQRDRPGRRSLRAIRESQMMTQAELADTCYLSRSTILALEKGRRPQPSTARIIAEVLHVEVMDIAWGRVE